MPDEPTHEPRRRRPFLLAMLVAGALLLAVATTGVAGGGGSSPSSEKSTGTSGAPAQSQPGAGSVHRGRHCHHDGNRQQQSPTEAPPV